MAVRLTWHWRPDHNGVSSAAYHVERRSVKVITLSGEARACGKMHRVRYCAKSPPAESRNMSSCKTWKEAAARLVQPCCQLFSIRGEPEVVTMNSLCGRFQLRWPFRCLCPDLVQFFQETRDEFQLGVTSITQAME